MSDKVSDGTLDGLINLLKAGAGCNSHDVLLALQELQALRAQQQAAGWRVKCHRVCASYAAHHIHEARALQGSMG